MHHVCQVTYEFNNDYEGTMTKKCYACILLAIHKEKNKSSAGVAFIPPIVKDLVVAPTNTSVVLENDNIAADSIPTNVAPERDDFVPPDDIHIDEGLPTQNGFSKNSGIFGIEIIFMGKAIGAECTIEKGYGRIVDVPKKKSNQTDYVIEYDESKAVDVDDIREYTTRIPGNKENKKLLKRAFALADKEGYRFGGVKKKAGNQRKKDPQNHRIDSNTILLPGILHENSKEAADRSELASNSDDEISNEGSTCDMNDSAFYDTNPSDEEQDDVVEASYLGEEWAWDQFEEFDDNGPVPGPEETDHYNGPHGLKPNVKHNFKTILQNNISLAVLCDCASLNVIKATWLKCQLDLFIATL